MLDLSRFGDVSCRWVSTLCEDFSKFDSLEDFISVHGSIDNSILFKHGDAAHSNNGDAPIKCYVEVQSCHGT